MTPEDSSTLDASHSDHSARRQRRIGWTMTLIMAVLYFGYLLAVVFAPQAMAIPVSGNISAGLLLGADVIISALGLATYYVAQANRNDQEKGGRS